MVMIANIFNEQLQLPAMEELYFQKARSAVYAPLQLPVLTFAEKAMSTSKIEVEVETPRARIEGHFMNIESTINVEIEEEKIDSEDLEPEVQYTKLHEFEFGEHHENEDRCDEHELVKDGERFVCFGFRFCSSGT